jgi:CubicO group peptidase (beta-lactamase class C family)
MRGLAASLIALSAMPLSADTRTDPIAEALADWLGTHGGKGAIAIVKNGEVLAEHNLGLDPSALAELASLSKAVTAVCANALVNEGVMSWQDSFSALYGSGPDVVLGDLVTHTAGLAPDGTQLGMALWVDQPTPRSADVLNLIDLRGGNSGEHGTYYYNNENYALLGLAIEAATGDTYEDACRKAALEPAGATGQASARTGAFLPWGGWQMTPADYARFAEHWFGAGSAIAAAPLDYPHDVRDGRGYGLGMVYRTEGDVLTEFLHAGLWCFPGRFNAASYVYGQVGAYTGVVVFDQCMSAETARELEDALFEAARQVFE